MNKVVNDLKKKFLQRKLVAIDSINQVAKELDSLAKEKTVSNAVNILDRIEVLFEKFSLKDTNDLIRAVDNSDQLKSQGKELARINKALTLIYKKNPEINIKDVIKWPSKPSEAIPVVLTDKFKEEFYDAIKSLPVYFGGGGIDTSNLATKQLQQTLIDAVNNIEINADSINLNTDDLEEKLDTIIAGMLLDNHQVTVSNQITQPTTPADIQPVQEQNPIDISGLAKDSSLTDGSQVTQVKSFSSLYNGSKTVPTGTAEAIATTQEIHSVTIKTLSTNTVAVYVGGTGVTTSNGIELLADESVTIDVDDLAKVFVISGSSSQVIRYIAV